MLAILCSIPPTSTVPVSARSNRSPRPAASSTAASVTARGCATAHPTSESSPSSAPLALAGSHRAYVSENASKNAFVASRLLLSPAFAVPDINCHENTKSPSLPSSNIEFITRGTSIVSADRSSTRAPAASGADVDGGVASRASSVGLLELAKRRIKFIARARGRGGATDARSSASTHYSTSLKSCDVGATARGEASVRVRPSL
jgi:hypothetical protein